MKKSIVRAFAPNPLIAALALAFPLWPTLALAAPTVAASGNFALGASPYSPVLGIPKSGQFVQPAVSTPFSAGAVGSPQTAYDSSAAVLARTLGGGIFGAEAITSQIYGANNAMTSQVKVTYVDSIVNTSASAQLAHFDIAISSLRFAYDYGMSTDNPSGTNRTSFIANVFVNGASTAVWSTMFTWNNWAVTSSGVDIGLGAAQPSTCNYSGSPSCSFGQGGFGIQNYLTTIGLGSVAAGQTLDIRYEIELQTETNLYGGDASIFFNDPSTLSLSSPPAAALAFDTSSPSPVPEPETYLMMAAGLGVLAATARRRRRG